MGVLHEPMSEDLGMQGKTVYLLTHEYELDGCDRLKILGIYSEQSLAATAQAYFQTQPGFCDHQDGFEICATRLDQNLWSEGFVTYRYPLE
jgi:hypothetical protein